MTTSEMITEFMEKWTARIRDFIEDYDDQDGKNILYCLAEEYGDGKVDDLAKILDELIFPIIVLQFSVMFGEGPVYAKFLDDITEAAKQFESVVSEVNN